MRASDVFGRLILGGVGLLLLTIPAAEAWRAAASPYPLAFETTGAAGTACGSDAQGVWLQCWEAFTPLGIVTSAWMLVGSALALYAAATGRPGPTMPASVVAGTAWIPAIAETLRARSLLSAQDVLGALAEDPSLIRLSARLVILTASMGVLLVVASIAMRRATPST